MLAVTTGSRSRKSAVSQPAITVSATLVRNVLGRAGVPPAPERAASSWRSFLRQHGNTILACDLFTVDTVLLRRLYVLFFIELATRRIAWYAVSDRPDATWVTQQARNLVWQLADGGGQARFLVHVLVFSGVFLERQYRAFTGLAHGQKTHDFLATLVTAGYAGDLGREVFAVPGRITAEESRGTNALLRDGAILVRNWADVVQELPDMWRSAVRGPRHAGNESARPSIQSEEGRVLALLRSDEPIHIEALITGAEISPARAAAALVGLELGGWARQLEGQRWLAAAVHGEGRTPSGDP